MNYKIILLVFLIILLVSLVIYFIKIKENYYDTEVSMFLPGFENLSEDNITLLVNAFQARNPDLLNGNQTLLNYYNQMLIANNEFNFDSNGSSISNETLDKKNIVNLRGDFFVKDIDENIKNILKNKNINTSKICIYEEDVNDPNKIDVECINAQEFFSKVNLPDYRKNKLCIDDKCLDKRDLEILNGTRPFKIVSDHTHSKWNNKCINQTFFTDTTCSSFPLGNTSNPYATYFNFKSLYPADCNTSTNFKFVKGKNNKETIANILRNGVSDVVVVPPAVDKSHHQ